MTQMDSTHSALLLGIALSLKSEPARLVYSDFLQEHNDPAWFTVRHYAAEDWPIWLNWEAEWKRRGKATKKHWQPAAPAYINDWSIPWIDGVVKFNRWITMPLTRTKAILTAFAKGDVKL